MIGGRVVEAGAEKSRKGTSRPVAIRFESDRHPFFAWLRERDRGSALLIGSGSAVWYLDFGGATVPEHVKAGPPHST